MAKKDVKNSNDFDFREIKTFEDACQKIRITTAKPDVSGIMDDDLRKPVTAVYKLMVIFKAINNGWTPDWGNRGQAKYFPWFRVLSSGFGFDDSFYICECTAAIVGSRLCTDSSEKALYIAEQFKAEYQDFFLYSE
jgi:hypothetical protein